MRNFLIFGCLMEVVLCRNASLSSEQRLVKDLFEHYNRATRPIRDSLKPVQVELIFQLQQIDALDAKNQELQVTGWLEVDWTDEHLQWDPEEYGGVESLTLLPEMVWLPSIALDNSAGDVYDPIHFRYFRVVVDYEGSAYWEPGGKFASTCIIDIKYYPFDEQKCHITFANWETSGKYVNLTAVQDSINLEKYTTSGEWHIQRSEVKRNERVYECCLDEPYPELHFIIYIRRKTLFYFTNIVIPCLFLSFLSLLVFQLPPDSGEKISLAITILLAFSVFSLIIADNIPNTSDAVPLLGIYLITAMGLTAATLVLSVLVLNLHHKGSKRRASPGIRRFVLVFLAKVAFMAVHYEENKNEIAEQDNKEKGNTEKEKTKRKHSSIYGYEIKKGISSIASLVKRIHDKDEPKHNEFMNSTAFGRAEYSDKQDVDEKLSLLQKVECHLDRLTQKVSQTELDGAIIEEWKSMAQVVDRILFLFFLISVSIITSLLLGIMPLFNPGKGG